MNRSPLPSRPISKRWAKWIGGGVVLGLLFLVSSLDNEGWIGLTDSGKVRQAYLINLDDLRKEGSSDRNLVVLQGLYDHHQELAINPAIAKGWERGRFLAVVAKNEALYSNWIWWKLKKQKDYTTTSLSQDIENFSKLYPKSTEIENLNAKLKVLAERDRRAFEKAEYRRILGIKDFKAYETELEHFRDQFPKSSFLGEMDNRYSELNDEYLLSLRQ